MSITPTDEEKDDLLLTCRYGDLEELHAFTDRNGSTSLAEIRDDNGNTALHMICANGHVELLDYILPLVPSSLLAAQNNSGSTALHWAALNSQLAVAKKLALYPGGPGLDLIDVKNVAGRSPLGEAENAGWEEGAKWFVEVMKLDPEGTSEQPSFEDDATLDPEDGHNRDIEVEIEDAEGQIAKMTIPGTRQNTSTSSEPTKS